MSLAEPEPHPDPEVQAVRERYARRTAAGTVPDAAIGRYSLLQPDVHEAVMERQQAVLRLFGRLGWTRLDDKRALEVGCGSGGNLLELLRFGFAPQHLAGIELLEERWREARHRLPEALALHLGDAADPRLAELVAPASQQLVLQSTVFSSLLDPGFRQRLAQRMWQWVAPGGGVLWYDFTVNNPRNPDVRGVPVREIRALFPQGRVQAERLTLLPPLARRLGRWSPWVRRGLAALPPLRTHVLAWIEKPADGAGRG